MKQRHEDKIVSVRAVETLCGSGRPTVEVTVVTGSGFRASGSAPSGTSRGGYEAVELLDGGERYRGKGVRSAVEKVNALIAPVLIGRSPRDFPELDRLLLELDGTTDKSHLGANAILPTSVALAKLSALSASEPVYNHLRSVPKRRLPIPMATVIAGGEYSSSRLEFEDYLLILSGFESFSAAVERLSEIRTVLEEILTEKFGPIPDVGGALSPPLSSTEEAFDYILEAAGRAGCREKVSLGLDVAANELFDPQSQRYRYGGRTVSPDELLTVYRKLAGQYPLTYIEDPFQEDDFAATRRLREAFPDRLIVGDDLYASNHRRIAADGSTPSANGILLKINQVGSVSETLQTAVVAREREMTLAVSLRSNDTGDDFIADLAVAVGAEYIKLGSPVRGERNVKYNRLLTIEDEISIGESAPRSE